MISKFKLLCKSFLHSETVLTARHAITVKTFFIRRPMKDKSCYQRFNSEKHRVSEIMLAYDLDGISLKIQMQEGENTS